MTLRIVEIGCGDRFMLLFAIELVVYGRPSLISYLSVKLVFNTSMRIQFLFSSGLNFGLLIISSGIQSVGKVKCALHLHNPHHSTHLH
jgi:hypothetical protein